METLPFNYLKPWFCHGFVKVPKPRTHGGKGEVSPNVFKEGYNNRVKSMYWIDLWAL